MIRRLMNDSKSSRLRRIFYRARNGAMPTSSPMMSSWMYRSRPEGDRIR